MMCASVTFLLCLATLLLAQDSWQVGGLSLCPCLKTSGQVLRKEQIEGYMRQKAGACHIDAILFKTVKGIFICSHPQKRWVKIAITHVDNKKAVEMTARPINSASTQTLNNTALEYNGMNYDYFT